MDKLPVVVLVAFLAGCSSPPSDGGNGMGTGDMAKTDPESAAAAVSDAPPGEFHLRGHVVSPTLVPIAGATVTVVGLGGPRVTAADGAFDFGQVERRLYTVIADAPGYLEASLTVPPDQQEPLRLVLPAGDPVVPYSTTVHFRGILECAFEAFIISPSCDSAITAGGGPALFDANQSLLFGAGRGWRTLVVDVVFDGDAHPGLDGLRIAVRGSLDPDGGGEYIQYGRWHGPQPFAARLDPGGSYPDGTEPVPANATGFQVDVYPHSHAYHPAEQGLLGVGFAQNVEFDVFATLFYVEPAPEGWSFLEASG